MLNIVSMNRAGLNNGDLKVKFEFEFNEDSVLPEKSFSVGQKTYLIANGSVAKNITTNKSYEYKDGKWIKVVNTSENETITKSNKITDNGDYNIPNNDSTGFNDVTVDVSGGGDISSSYITYGSYDCPYGPGSEALNNRRVGLIIVAPDDNGEVSYAATITEGSSTMIYSYAFVYGENIKRINLEAYQYGHAVTFKAGEDFEGFYYQNEPVSFEGTITAGTWYNALYHNSSVVVETNNYLGYTPMT